MVYMRGTSPSKGPPNRELAKKPLMIDPQNDREKLNAHSVLNLGKVHTVECNVKVKPIGFISKESMGDFRRYITI